uniref:Transmembrane protein n=1 Tax=Caenorhabditis tropicalis TaxID=1561998 RepID=A0A1I7UP35_9PELO
MAYATFSYYSKFLQPDADKFNLWNFLIGFLSLVMAQDVENCQREGTTFWQLISTSSPSALTGTIMMVPLLFPRLDAFVTTPYVFGWASLLGWCKMNSHGAAIGILYGSAYIGRGYGARAGAIALLVSFFISPCMTNHFRLLPDWFIVNLFSKSIGLKFGVIMFAQIVLNFLAVRHPLFFINTLSFAMRKASDVFGWGLEVYRDNRVISSVVTNFNLTPDYFYLLATWTLQEGVLHRRSSQRNIRLLGENSPDVGFESIGLVFTNALGRGTDVAECRIEILLIELTDLGRNVIANGSPEYQMYQRVKVFKRNKQRFDEDAAAEIHRAFKDEEILERSFNMGLVNRKRKVNSDQHIYWPMRLPREDKLQKTLVKLDRGETLTYREIEPYKERGMFTMEIKVTGQFAVRNRIPRETNDFELIARR